MFWKWTETWSHENLNTYWFFGWIYGSEASFSNTVVWVEDYKEFIAYSSYIIGNIGAAQFPQYWSIFIYPSVDGQRIVPTLDLMFYLKILKFYDSNLWSVSISSVNYVFRYDDTCGQS